jgi:hypothetical protein
LFERLLERGARLVHVCDPEPARVAEATAKNRSAAVSYSALADGHFALRDGAFDLCVVEDAGITDPVALVKKVRRALTPRGVAVLATLNPEARVPLMPHRPSGMVSLDYYALYDAVKAEFEYVRMLGQAPFVGYVIADFAPEGNPEPSLDTAFLPSGAEEPELFIAVASQKPIELEQFSVVQLPYRSVVSGSGGGDTDALRRAKGEAEALRNQLRETEAELSARSAKLREAETELSARGAKLRDTENELNVRGTKLRDAENELNARGAKLREAETRVFARDTELGALRQELEHKNRHAQQQEASLNELSAKLKQGPSPEDAAAAAAELTALESALAERGEHIRKLERDLREAERVGKELVRQLPNPDDSTARRASEVELAQKLAKAQADLIATRWALEAAVKRGNTSENPEA